MKQTITLLTLLCLFLIPLKNFSQTSGVIVRPAGSAGPAVLDTNLNGYTSKLPTGFGADDISNSELSYKVVPAIIAEPTGDLLRGPSDRFSDIVKTVDGSGFYIFNDGTNLLVRLRMGGIVSGSKGYSLLLDTDSKFGATGPSADPNYQPATTGINGNPGFELEIVYETNFRIAVYNVDGTSNPVLLTTYPLATHSQISIAATQTSGDLDYFYDYYVPFAALGITASTPLRATATTVMSPQAAIGGPKSDVYGLSGDDYMEDWTTFITSQPPFTLNDVTTGGTGVSAVCTSAPFLNGSISPTATTVTGTWTKATNSLITSATITLYQNGVAIGTPTVVNSGNTWSINVTGLLVGNAIITAKAQAAGESQCLASNSEKVLACNAGNIPATPILSCISGSKGLSGTNLSTGWTVHVDNITRSVNNDNVINTGALFGSTTGSSPNISWPFSGGCSSGAPLTSGSYKIYYTDNVTGCASAPAYFCAAGNGGNALAGSLSIGITTPSGSVFTPATDSIVGTTLTGATVNLFVNGILNQTTTAAAGTFTFAGLSFITGQKVGIVAELTGGTVGTSYCSAQFTDTVECLTNPPIITVGNTGKLVATLPITGTSSDATGTTIRVYTSANTLVATTTVQANGTWSTGNVGTLPGTYNAVNATSYYATAQNGSCGLSSSSVTYLTATATSNARCGTLPATVNESATSISGTLTGTLANTLVTLYVDDISVGSFTTSTTAWGPIAVNTTVNNTIYSGAVLTIGITEPNKTEIICAASVTVTCTVPTSPNINPTLNNIVIGNTVTYTINSSQTGILYSLTDSATNTNFGTSKFGTGGSITLTTNTFSSMGNYTMYVKATSFSGVNCESTTAARVVASVILPVNLVSFDGKYNNGIAQLQWITSSEQSIESFELEKSFTGGNDFVKVATINTTGNSQLSKNYSFNDPILNMGVIYYRLKMVDKNNGLAKYSKIITLHIAKGIVLNNISPNPFSSFINVNLVTEKDVPLTITLTDLIGRKIKSISYAAKAGLNKVSLTSLSSIAKGTYIIQLTAAGENIIRQLLIKQ
ncbi:MAG: T9SS type A sorting domain-containing protein [Bacteroidota bacterium]